MIYVFIHIQMDVGARPNGSLRRKRWIQRRLRSTQPIPSPGGQATGVCRPALPVVHRAAFMDSFEVD